MSTCTKNRIWYKARDESDFLIERGVKQCNASNRHKPTSTHNLARPRASGPSCESACAGGRDLRPRASGPAVLLLCRFAFCTGVTSHMAPNFPNPPVNCATATTICKLHPHIYDLATLFIASFAYTFPIFPWSAVREPLLLSSFCLSSYDLGGSISSILDFCTSVGHGQRSSRRHTKTSGRRRARAPMGKALRRGGTSTTGMKR